MIEGVILKKLIVHQDERGALFEILRADEKIFKKFGQAYITICKKGWVKGWHYHKKQWDYFCVVRGKAKIVLYDRRRSRQGGERKSSSESLSEYILSAEKPQLLRIPPGVIHGFECISKQECWILNIPTQPYARAKPDEYRLPLNSPVVPYKPWQNCKGW